MAKPVQVNFSRLKWGDFGGAIVGAAGPASNLLIAVVVAAIYPLVLPVYGSYSYEILTIACELNLSLLLINLIPWPPLDGSRILYAFAPEPLQELMARLEAGGIMNLLFFLLVFSFLTQGNGFWSLISRFMHVLGVPLPVI